MSVGQQEYQAYHAERMAKLEGLFEQGNERIEFMEKLFISIDRKLWAIIILVVGAIVIPFIKGG